MKPFGVKLTKKLAALDRGLYISPSWVSNGSWLIRRALLSNPDLLDSPDSVILSALGGKLDGGMEIRREVDDEKLSRPLPKGGEFLRARVTPWRGSMNQRIIKAVGVPCAVAINNDWASILAPFNDDPEDVECLLWPVQRMVTADYQPNEEDYNRVPPTCVMPLRLSRLPEWWDAKDGSVASRDEWDSWIAMQKEAKP